MFEREGVVGGQRVEITGGEPVGEDAGGMGLPVLLATALAPSVGAVLTGVTGSYANAFAVLAALAAVGTVLMITSARTSTSGRAEVTASQTV